MVVCVWNFEIGYEPLSTCVSSLQTVEAFEILLLTMLSAVLKCEWGLTEVEEATLTSVSVPSNTRLTGMSACLYSG